MAEEDKGAVDKLDAIRDSLTRLHGRMDGYEGEMKARKDAEEMTEKKRSMFDAHRRDRFGPRKDGEKYMDWKRRHDADEAAMCDAMRKDGADDGEAMADAKRARRDAEEAEKKEDAESFEEWAKEEGEEPEHKKADKARKDGEGEEMKKAEAEKMAAEEEAKKDSAKRIAGLEAQLAEMRALIKGVTAETPASERDALASAQARHDGVAARFGDRAPPPLPGETSLAYRRRLLSRLQRHSPRLKDSSFAAMDSASLALAEDVVYADAVHASSQSATATPGILVPVTYREGGRDVTRYEGDPMAWMQHFMTGAQVGRFRDFQKRA